MWSKAKSIGGSVVKKAKSAGSFVAKKAKAGITAVKKGVKAISPKALIANAKKMISGSAGKILPKVLKLPLIGPVIEGVFAAMEVKDIMANPELTAKDKQKQVGAIVGKSVGGLMGGAIASIGAQALNVAPGLGAVLTPVAYLGGDFLGRMAADALMNNVPNVDTMLGEATGKIFNLDYNQGSKAEETSKPGATAAAAPKPQSAEKTSSPDTLAKTIDDVDTKSTAIPDNKTTISPDQLATSSSGAVALQSIPGSNLKTKTTPTVGKQTDSPKTKTSASTLGKVAAAGTGASVLAGSIAPSTSTSPTAGKKSYKPAADNSNTVSDQPESENQTQTVNLEDNQQLQDIIDILPKPGESLLSSTATDTEPAKPESKINEPGEESTESLSMVDKTKNLAKKVYPTSMIGRIGNKTKQIASKIKPGLNSTVDTGKSFIQNQKSKLTSNIGSLGMSNKIKDKLPSLDTIKNTTGKATSAIATGGKSLLSKGSALAVKSSSALKDKLPSLDTIKSTTGKAGKSMMSRGKSLLSKGSALAVKSGSALKDKLPSLDTIKSTTGKASSAIATGGKSLLSKGSALATKSSSALKDKLGETMGSIGQSKKAVRGKPKSFIDSIKSGFKQSKLGKMFGFSGSDSDNSQPQAGQSKKAVRGKPKSFIDSIKSGFKQSKLGKMFGSGEADSNQSRSIPGSSLLGKIKSSSTKVGKRIKPIIKSGKSFIQNQKSKYIGKAGDNKPNKSNYFMDGMDSLGVSNNINPGDNKPSVSSSSPGRNLLSRAAPMGEKVKSTVLSGVAKLKEKSRGLLDKSDNSNNNQPTNNNNSNTNNNDGGSSSTVISNSSNSTNTTTINKYDTDVVSRWRSGYIEDQHKPGHYSLYS